MSDLKALRQQYSDQGLDEQSTAENPFEQFGKWFQQAMDSGMAEANGFSLCTVAADSKPTQRTVLLKYWDAEGFVFYTNHGSRKGRQMMENSSVSMLFPWYALHRQINIEGVVSRVDDNMSEAYFQSRPRGSQVGAWASRQSEVIDSRELLEDQITKIEQRFEGKEKLPLPEFWGGYRVKPTRFEFWQGRTHRLHDRIVYMPAEDRWEIFRLSP